MMKKTIITIAMIVSAVVAAFAADNPTAVLSEASARLKSAKSIVASCVISSASGASNASLTMSGKKFAVKSPEIEIWYDGTTQWTYSARTDEVSVTEPAAAEISQVNPLAVLDYFTSSYTPTMLPPSKGVKRIKLTAKDKKSGIASAVITLQSASLSPECVELTLSTGERVSITVKSLKKGGEVNPATFTYRKSLHPSAEIIDLR